MTTLIPKIDLKNGGSTPAGAVNRTINEKAQDILSVKDFGAKGDGSTDDTAAIQAARDYIAAQDQPIQLIFPSGIYVYSVSPNWSIQNVSVVPDGEVRLRYTGTGNAVIIDSATDTYNVTFGTKSNKFIIEAPSTAGHGLYLNGASHSCIGVNVKGCGSTSAGVYVNFAVCTDFYVVVSSNEDGWYLSAQPQYGIYTNRRSVGEPVSYCVFHTPIIEWTVYGLYNKYSNGNMYIGGTFEGCSKNGIYIDTLGTSDKYIGVDLEANNQSGGTYADILCVGTFNEFLDCDTMDLFQFGSGSIGNTLTGGIHKSIHNDSTTTSNKIIASNYNRGAGGGNLTDNGIESRVVDTIDMQTGKYFVKLLGTTSITPTASPYAYTNSNQYNVSVVVTAGTVLGLTLTRSPTTPVSLGLTQGMFTLAPGDVLEVTYSSAPFLVVYPQPVL